MDGLLGRDQPFGAERDCADAGALEAEEGQEFTAGNTEVGGVGGRFDEGSGACGAGPVGVGDGQRDRLGDALLVAEPGTELLDETEDGAVVLVRVELVAVEPARSTDRFRRDSRDDGTVVLAAGTVVGLTGGDAEDPLEGGGRGIGDVADRGDPVPGQGPCAGGANTGKRHGRLGTEERGDLVRAVATIVAAPGAVTAAAIAAIIRFGPAPAEVWTPWRAIALSLMTPTSPAASCAQ